MAKRNPIESGMLGLGPAILARNPETLRGFGVLGNLAANELEDRKEDKARQAAMAAQPAEAGMRKGGKVKKMAAGGSASKRADGCATKGKTRGKMI